MGPFGMQGNPMGGPMGGPMMSMGMNFPMGAGRPPFMVANGMEGFGGFGGPGFGGGFGPGFGGMQRARPDQMAPFSGPAGLQGPQPPPSEDAGVVAPARRVTSMMCAISQPLIDVIICAPAALSCFSDHCKECQGRHFAA